MRLGGKSFVVESASLRWKINLMGVAIVVVFSIITYFLILPYMEREKVEERKGKLRAVVNSVVSLMDYYERELRREAWRTDPSMPRTSDEGKRLILQNLRQMRYDKTEYFFILDGDGKMILHPLKAELEGLNMIEAKDPEGRAVFRDLVRVAQRDGEAFVGHVWEAKYSSVIFEPQTTYGRYFWPWDWVVCSSLYTQDIVDAMRAITIRSSIYDAVAAAVALTALIVVLYFALSRPLKRLLDGVHQIHDGNLDYQIPVRTRDEIGFISQEFNLMVSDLKASRDSLLISESKYRQLADMLPDIIYECDRRLNLTYMNGAGFALTGYSEEDLKRGLSISDLVVEEDFETVKGFIEKGNSRKFLTTHKIIRKDGSFLHGENNGLVLFENGDLLGLRGSIRDVTEKLKMEEQILQSQKMETIGTLAGGLAHDFNNVLSGITSTISIIRYQMGRNPELGMERFKKHLDIMEQSGNRAADMVQQLLTLSRKREAVIAPVDLVGSVRNVIKICRNTFDRCISIEVETPAAQAMIRGDQTQIEQVLLNLCVNASHAMTIMRPKEQSPGGRLMITLDIVSADAYFCATRSEAREIRYWKIAVRDTGVGMDPSTLPKIFVPFFTTKGKGVGTGLGLSMVYTIVQQHSGFIDVYSEPGVGTTFNVYLPNVEIEGAADDGARKIEIPRGEGLILVIDDEEVLRHTARTMLEECGYRVVTAADGEEGVAIFRDRHYEIRAVLTDLVMPKKSGDLVYRELRLINPEVKVVLTSGFKQDDRVNLALAQGIDGFIQKPYTIDRLARVLADVLPS